MFEAKLTITAPGLEAALNNLAAAIAGAKAAAPTTVQAPPQGPTAPVPTQAPPQAPANPTPAAPPAAPAPTAPQAAPQAGPTSAYPSNPAPGPIPTAASAGFPGPAPTPVSQASPLPQAGLPLGGPPQYTVDQIMQAGATLMDAGKVTELTNLLHSFGVQAVMDLKPEQLGAFATEMRKMGAAI